MVILVSSSIFHESRLTVVLNLGWPWGDKGYHGKLRMHMTVICSGWTGYTQSDRIECMRLKVAMGGLGVPRVGCGRRVALAAMGSKSRVAMGDTGCCGEHRVGTIISLAWPRGAKCGWT